MKHTGLVPRTMNLTSGKYIYSGYFTVGAMTDSYYEILLKSWLFDPKIHSREHYDTSTKAITKYLLQTKENYTFLGEMRTEYYSEMDTNQVSGFVEATMAHLVIVFFYQ